MALGLNFFALLGATFYLVYYLQGVRGYTPLQSGVAFIPVALGMAIMAPRSSGLAERFGAKAVCASGFGLIALSFPACSCSTWTRRSGCCSLVLRCRGSAWAR